MRGRRWLPDLVIVVVIVVSGQIVGGVYRKTFIASGAPEEYGQTEFGAAVALACGYGFIDPGSALTPALAEYSSR